MHTADSDRASEPGPRLDGVLVVDKPAGPTSARVVAQVKRALGVRRVGHTGTLDPMATGVLPLCLGEATKIAGYLLAEDKVYEGQLLLGVETDTLDAQGAVTARAEDAAAAVREPALRRAMAALVGPGEQIPPMYSALRRGGRRLHELARAGHEVERPPRPIVIHRLDLDHFDPPAARFTVHCSKGTYVRSLVADLGRALGCGAHLTALRRTRSGPFDIAQALSPEGLTPALAASALIPPAAALPHLAEVVVGPDRAAYVGVGKPLSWDLLGVDPAGTAGLHGSAVKLVDEDGRLLALIASPDAAGPAGSGPPASTPTDGPRGHERVTYLRVFTYSLTNPAPSSKLTASRGREPSRPRR
ncbi:tRNA pseudouridine(55) synthase TruB [Haliangium sp.]|uniref:tRNA pseudouridine(55) synthase TruB n=1 Tax=Haliangium sp. TaxID=2663208 RepID=UPI003D09FFA4